MKILSVILGYNPTLLSILFIYVAKLLLETNSSLSLSPPPLGPPLSFHCQSFSFSTTNFSLSPLPSPFLS